MIKKIRFIYIYRYQEKWGIEEARGGRGGAASVFRCVSSSLKATKSHFRCSIFIYTAPPLCFFIHTVGGGVGGVAGWWRVGGVVAIIIPDRGVGG